MREELEIIKKIEDYINGQLSAAENVEFEVQMNNDLKLQAEVKLQREILMGLERIVLKQMIQQVGIRYRLRKQVIKWGLVGLGIIAIIVAIIVIMGKISDYRTGYEKGGLPEYNELGKKNWTDADRNLKAQTFLLNTSADTVIETKGGIVLSVPAMGFIDKDGNPVSGEVELVLKEALNPAAIMYAGLSSIADGKLLESGGMFFVDARQNGRILKINPANSIYAQIPADSSKAGMQLFQGKRLPDGRINWVNPRPLVHDLVPADILSLDFYPPGYRDSLAKWGYDKGNKKFTDSLYYSIAALFSDVDKASKPAISLTSKIVRDSLPTIDSVGLTISCGINPAKIKTIWNQKFQNTLLATHEFGQRLYWLHKLGNDVAFDLYVENLDKPLSAIDTMVANRSTGRLKEIFHGFAATNAGKVNNGLKQFKKLQEYYRMKTKLFTEAISKTEAEFQKRQMQLDQIAASKQDKHLDDSAKRADQNFREEFNVNLKKAYKQLGYEDAPQRSITVGLDRPNVYTVQISSTGWCNVDRFVAESTAKRTTLNFTDQRTGKKAVIKYLPVSFTIEQPKAYDKLYVYLLPDKLSSYMRLKDSAGKYAEHLNELMKYNVVCVGYKGEKLFLYAQKNIQPKDYSSIKMVPDDETGLERLLIGIGNTTQSSALKDENSFLAYEIKDAKRRKHNLAWQQLNDKLVGFIFPCYGAPVSKPAMPLSDEDRVQFK